MKPDYSSPYYEIKGNPLLRNCYVDKGKKPLEVEELKECCMETFKENMTPEYYKHEEDRLSRYFDHLAKKINFDDDEKVPMEEFIRLYCTRRL